MNTPFRRKPLALLICYGFLTPWVLSQTEALAQTPEPFRVDPALLGLPAVHAAKAPSVSETIVQQVQVPVVDDLSQTLKRDNSSREVTAESKREKNKRAAAPKANMASVPSRLAGAENSEKPKTSSAEASAGASVSEQPVISRREYDHTGDNAPSAQKIDPNSQTVYLDADQISGDVGRASIAEGSVVLKKQQMTATADKMTYWPVEDEVEAVGNVKFEENGSQIEGPKMRLHIEDKVGTFDQPSYRIRREVVAPSVVKNDVADFSEAYWNSGFEAPKSTRVDYASRVQTMSEARGEADRMDFEGENHYRLFNSTYTTCTPGDNSWYAKSSDMRLDYDQDEGEAKDATVYFQEVPVLYSPWLSFPLSRERRSGLLPPSLSTGSNDGLKFSQPYYWNIAPNMDATITPTLMTSRGVQLTTDFRYLNRAYGGGYTGEFIAQLLPKDQQYNDETRYGIFWKHEQKTANGFSALINYSEVSDNQYQKDFPAKITSDTESQLLQQAQFGYSGGGWWNATVNFQQYHTLQPDSSSTVAEQYQMLPQITFNAQKLDYLGTDSKFMGQYTVFTKRQQWMNGVKTSDPEGNRLVLSPQISLPYVTSGWYVTPKLGVNYRNYSLTNLGEGDPSNISVTLPIASVDSGMTFERASNWFGRDYTQTLEPRLYYVYIPYRDQSQIPVFDSALADFNFAQIFSENQFSGWDRINNANQLTAAVSSRLIDPNSGAELVRVMLGQRYYFEPNRVGLTSATTASEQKWSSSNFLASFSGQILPKVYLDSALQYSPSSDENKVQRFSLGSRYQPESGKVLNASYRFNKDSTAPTNQIDLSGQWPIKGKWFGVGRLNYSFKDDGTVLESGAKEGRLINSVAGLEYNAGCWVLRTVIQRKAVTSAESTSAFFVQLELNDFSTLGSDPISLLKSSVQGYGLVNQTGTTSAFSN